MTLFALSDHAARLVGLLRARDALRVGAAIASLLATPVVAQSGLEPPPPYQAVDRFGVDMTSGSLQVSSSTISVGDPARGGMSFTASWDSTAWAWRYSNWGEITWELAKPDPYCLVFYTVVHMGSSNVFQREACGSNNFDRLDGHGTLVETTTGFTYTARDGSVATYPGKTRETPIQSIVRLDGEVITYNYAGGPLRSVSNNLGYQLHFDYIGTTLSKVTAINNVVDACAPSATTCSFSTTWPSLTFTTSGAEKRVTDALNRTTRIIFDGTAPYTSKILAVARPTGVTWSSTTYTNEYVRGRGHVVATASDGAGTWTYAYESYCPPEPFDCFRPEDAYDLATTVTDPNGHPTVYNIAWAGRYVWNPALGQELMLLPSLYSIKNALNQTTLTSQSGAGLHGATFPEGNSISIGRNDRGDVTSITQTPKQGSGLSVTSSTVVYPNCATEPIKCYRPSSTTDARGNTTDYTYDAAGNLLTETGPAPAPGAPRPQARYVWEQRYAWYKQNGSSAITRAATPVWVQVSQSQCMTGATC